MSVRTNWEMHGLSEPAVRSFEMQIRGEVIHPGDGEYDAARRVWNVAWPWALTPITRSAIAAWLIGLGVAAGHALIRVALTAVSGWALLPSPAATKPPGDHAVADLGADAADTAAMRAASV